MNDCEIVLGLYYNLHLGLEVLALLSRILPVPIRTNQFFSSILYIYVKSKPFSPSFQIPGVGPTLTLGKYPDDTDGLIGCRGPMQMGAGYGELRQGD